MKGTALLTDEIKFLLQRCIQDFIAFTATNRIKFDCVNFNGLLSVINMHMCDVLLNLFVQYISYLEMNKTLFKGLNVLANTLIHIEIIYEYFNFVTFPVNIILCKGISTYGYTSACN